MTTESSGGDSWQTEGTFYYQTKATQSLSEGVIRAVASLSGQNPTPLNTGVSHDGEEALDPLYDAINPDALDDLFDTGTGTSHSSGNVRFHYCGYEVTVERTGLVTVTET